MKTLIAYFSLDGNAKWMAEQIHKKLPNATLHEIELAKKPLESRFLRTMVYGFKTTFYKTIPIKKTPLDMAIYDRVIIGSPVWMGSVPPPIRAFINEYPMEGKQLAAFCSMGQEPLHFFNRLKKYLEIDTLDATLAIIDPLKNLNEETLVKIDSFVEKLENAYQTENDLV